MLLGPIFNADLVTSARRTRYYLWRIAYGLILLFTLWTSYESTAMYGTVSIATAANLAESFFGSFAYVQLLAIVAVGPAIAGGSIAQERERRTLEYLLATDLTTTEIVLGKLGSRGLQIAAAILAGLPVMFIAGLLGGIAPLRLLPVMLVSVSTLIMVCCMAMAISTRAARARDGVVQSYAVLATLLIGPYLLLGLCYAVGMWQWADSVSYLMTFNPFATVSQMLWSRAPTGLWQTVASTVCAQLVLSVICVALVYTKIRSVEGVGQPAVKKAKSIAVTRHVYEDWPMLWKEVRLRRPLTRWGWVVRIVLGLVIGGYLLAVIGMASGPSLLSSMGFLLVLIGCFGLLAIAARAASALTSERERYCWDSLRLTLLSDFEIASAKVCGAIWSVWPLGLIFGLMWCCLMIQEPKTILGTAIWAFVAMLLATYVAALGLCFSAWAKNSVRSMIWTAGVAVFFGGGYFFCCIPLLFASTWAEEIIMAPAIPFLLAYPIFIWEDSGPSSALLSATFVTGIMAYAITTFILFASTVGVLGRAETE